MSDVPEIGDSTSDNILMGQDACPEGANEAHKARWLEIFLQFMESERFRNFVNTNFDIHSFVDNEERVVHTRVIERPLEMVMESILSQTPPPPPDAQEEPAKPVKSGQTRAQKAESNVVLSPAQLIKLHHALRTSGCKKPSGTVQKILGIIGQQEASLILPPSVGESS